MEKTFNFKSLVTAAILTLSCGLPTTAQTGSTHIEREYIEWADIWIPGANRTDKPHVLLIGNSITRGYHPEVEKALEDRAYVGRISTSKSLGDPAYLDEVESVLKHTRFDIIQFNNGLHGMEYSEEEYDKAFPELLGLFRKYAPDALLIWANCTPLYEGEGMTRLKQQSLRGTARNGIARRHVLPLGIEINALDTVMTGHPEYYIGGDGSHPLPAGYSALARQVISTLEKHLPAPPAD
ncbi:SGNH/GDSL hydrolase family protein [uncultured Muribaculum sp.]|uniref:SGNH/GDSL hydrolase family protein n=1 Tax=uncultured Muribaculum sp. TaxID=1918613 RepID=UPI002629E22A|nr:SGNH/GDSL hydrolase family protein [uncultured Muribaculum sp.]